MRGAFWDWKGWGREAWCSDGRTRKGAGVGERWFVSCCRMPSERQGLLQVMAATGESWSELSFNKVSGGGDGGWGAVLGSCTTGKGGLNHLWL